MQQMQQMQKMFTGPSQKGFQQALAKAPLLKKKFAENQPLQQSLQQVLSTLPVGQASGASFEFKNSALSRPINVQFAQPFYVYGCTSNSLDEKSCQLLTTIGNGTLSGGAQPSQGLQMVCPTGFGALQFSNDRNVQGSCLIPPKSEQNSQGITPNTGSEPSNLNPAFTQALFF